MTPAVDSMEDMPFSVFSAESPERTNTEVFNYPEPWVPMNAAERQDGS